MRMVQIVLGLVLAGGVAGHADAAAVANGSFESPVLGGGEFVTLTMTGWDKHGPIDSDSLAGIGELTGRIDTGIFRNQVFDPQSGQFFSKPGGEGMQAAFLLNRTDANDPIALTQMLPDVFEAGQSHELIAALSRSTAEQRPPIVPGSAMRMALYYDIGGSRAIVADRIVTGSELPGAAFSDFRLSTPLLHAGHPAVGEPIGILFEPVVLDPQLALGGAFEIDHVRLQTVPEPASMVMMAAFGMALLRRAGRAG